MSIKDILIADIKAAPPEVLRPLFELWQVLKKHVSPAPKGDGHPMRSFFGVLDASDADDMQQVIDEEFNRIDDEW